MQTVIQIAALVVLTMLVLLGAAFILNAYGIVSGKFDYPLPPELIGLCQLILGSATTVLTIAGLVEVRRAERPGAEEIAAAAEEGELAEEIIFIPEVED